MNKQMGSMRSPHCNINFNPWKLSTLLLLLLVALLLKDDLSILTSLSLASALMKDIAKIINSTDPVEIQKSQAAIDGALDNNKKYIPADTEQYVLDHADELGYASKDNPDGCLIYSDPTVTNEDIHRELTSYLYDLETYIAAVENFQPVPNVFDEIIKGNYEICSSLRLHPDSVSGLFPNSMLSYSSSGYVEPILPPMWSHGMSGGPRGYMGLDFIVHDFETMCRNLKPSSRRVLIDMGASLDFHRSDQPIMVLLAEYEKFGFHFNHIYTFEITFTEPSTVYNDLLPEKHMASYHWINVAADPEEGVKLNPLHSILNQFDEDDFVVVKLDVDTAEVEVPLVYQLLEGGLNGTYHKLVDQFYFEHHVHLGNIAFACGDSMRGSIKDSLELFHGLRVKGIPLHF